MGKVLGRRVRLRSDSDEDFHVYTYVVARIKDDMAQNERSIFIVFPVFMDYEIEVVVAKDAKLARSKRSALYGEYKREFKAIHSTDERGKALLVFPQNADINCIAHECFHAIIALMEWIGNDERNECAAYHLGYLTEQVYKFVRSRSKR